MTYNTILSIETCPVCVSQNPSFHQSINIVKIAPQASRAPPVDTKRILLVLAAGTSMI